jgi:hypothetical protein
MIPKLLENIGLHASTFGCALFFAFYDRILHEKYEVSQEIIDCWTPYCAEIESLSYHFF